MSCYPAHRPMYCYVVWGKMNARYAGVLPLPVIVGPFKTKTKAQNALATDLPECLPDGVYAEVKQIIPFYTPAGHLGSLHFDQMIDPKTVVRAPTKPKSTDKPVEQEGGEPDDDTLQAATVHLVPG